MNSIKSILLVSILFLSSISFAQTTEEATLNRQDFKGTANNTVSVTSYEKGNSHYVYSGGDGGNIDVFSLDQNGALSAISRHELAIGKGPARGLVASQISGTDYLFVGNKGANAVEVFKILENGSLERVFILNDTDETYIGTVITLQVIKMKNAAYLFVGGLEKTPGLSCFKIQSNGSLTHVQSQKDNDKIHTDGIIGMYVHKINGKTYLYTGGFQDNGLSGFRVYESGRFKNITNISDNTTDRFLTGTYPVTGVTLGDNHYVVVGHRHHKYYKRINFIKKKDFVYHGDAVSVFKVNKRGELLPHSTLIDDETTLLSGQTRIEILKTNDEEAIVAVGTRDDESIQLCKLNKEGVLSPLSSLKTGFPIYYGLNALKVKDELLFIAGAVRFDLKQLVSYKVALNSPSTKGKVLRHVVNLKFKADVSQNKIDEAVARFSNLKNQIPEIAHMEWGLNNSTEGHSKGFQYCFTLTFNNAHGREIYLFHKAHLALVQKVGPLLDDVFVMDYWTLNTSLQTP
ncbi:Dabb family protein [Sediminitomix flava]|uniref:Stress responsive alpha/beta barrel protein n=1 Tax=Sediminitomix flava TaxID=379075 RepID=A0A315ZDN4_SEDFL|nr:Dabb family protein [Sediminitomix flava]PWJ43715.1 stress responsive alpha/beta barrel protein [Sediminitomix flava]